MSDQVASKDDQIVALRAEIVKAEFKVQEGIYAADLLTLRKRREALKNLENKLVELESPEDAEPSRLAAPTQSERVYGENPDLDPAPAPALTGIPEIAEEPPASAFVGEPIGEPAKEPAKEPAEEPAEEPAAADNADPEAS